MYIVRYSKMSVQVSKELNEKKLDGRCKIFGKDVSEIHLKMKV